jgi:hypothetical protein
VVPNAGRAGTALRKGRERLYRAGTINGLTVRCFRNGRSSDRSPDGWCPAHLARLVSMAMPVSTTSDAPDSIRSSPACRSTGVDTAWVRGSHPTWQLVRRAVESVWDKCSCRPRPPQVSMVGVRPPWPLQPSVLDSSGSPTGVAGHFRCGRLDAALVVDIADRRPRPVSVRRVRWLQEPVAGLAAAGGLQPAPVDAGEPGGQAAAELAADIGHGRPGERAGLLEAEVVEL